LIELQYVPYREFERVRGITCASVERTRLFATLCRINALYMITRAGSGHIGSSFSAMDIVSWLYLNEMRLSEKPDGEGDVYFSSKGHDVPGLYAVLLGLGRLDFDLIHALRRLNGLPGHPDIATPGIAANTGSLGMGISKAKGMVLANRLQGREGNVYVLTGDGELQEGQFWESLPSAVHRGCGEITVIVDHNKIQSDTWVKEVNDLGDLERKLAAFGWEVARCDGHDLAALAEVLAAFKQVADRPKILIADTVKGAGVSFMTPTAMREQDELYRFHSGAPDDATYERAAEELIGAANEQLSALGEAPLTLDHIQRPDRPAPAAPQRLIPAYSRALVSEAEREPRLVVLDADLVLDCGLIPFKEKFPERFVECGIAEQDMVSTGSGLALRGMLPAVHSFACFLSTRPNEHFYNNASERTKVMYVGSLAGVLPGGPGHSHQSVRDIAALAANPGLILLEPCNEQETEQVVAFCVRGTESSTYLRLVSVPWEVPFALPADYRLEQGKGVALTEGEDALLFSYGPVMLSQAVVAAQLLRRDHGLGLTVVNLPWLNRVDTDWLRMTVQNYRVLLTLDNHYVAGGQGEMLAATLAETGLLDGRRLRRLGLTDLPACGQNDEVLRAHGLDAESLAATTAALCAAGAAG
jgi:transketolase